MFSSSPFVKEIRRKNSAFPLTFRSSISSTHGRRGLFKKCCEAAVLFHLGVGDSVLTFVDLTEGTGAQLLHDLEATLQNFLPVLQHTSLIRTLNQLVMIALSIKLITIIMLGLIRASTPLCNRASISNLEPQYQGRPG